MSHYDNAIEWIKTQEYINQSSTMRAKSLALLLEQASEEEGRTRGELHKIIQELTDQLREADDVLRSVEYVRTQGAASMEYCPLCFEHSPNHGLDCKLELAMKRGIK